MSDQPKNNTQLKSDTRSDSAAFDQPLFERELRQLVKQTQRNIDAGRRGVLETHRSLGHEFGEAYLVRMVVSDIGVLRDSFLPGVDKACRNAQRSGGNDITSRFVREELVPRVLSALNDRKVEIRGYLETLLLVAENSNRYFPSLLNHLSREMDDLRDDLKNDYEIEIANIRRQESQTRPSVAKKAIRLAGREDNIWSVIQRMSKGRQYCRELDGADIKPRKIGVWKGAPSTYIAAYDEGKTWRHRIEDEKSKIKRKAKLAKLATKLAGD